MIARPFATASVATLCLLGGCSSPTQELPLGTAHYQPDFGLGPNECSAGATYDAPVDYGALSVASALRDFGLDRETLRLREIRPGLFAAEQRTAGRLVAAYTVAQTEYRRWLVNQAFFPSPCEPANDLG